jgi:D-alanyl-D-alanine dipeptidase
MSMRRATSVPWGNPLLVLLASAAMLGCAANKPVATSTPPQSALSQSPPITAPPEPVRAALIRESATFASARAPRSSSSCNARVGSANAIRYESERFLVQLDAADPCSANFLNREAWLAASDVQIADSAYAPILARVDNQPGLRIAMAYTGNKIFCDAGERCRITEPLYATARCFAHPAVAEALQRAARTLHAREPSLTLKVLDCYRPIYVQERMFTLVADPKWVAQPKPPRYGGHNRAVAIDLTIEKNGVEFDMGTAFDAFDEKSEWQDDGRGITVTQQANRRALRSLMIESGFRPYDGEWWHFSLPFSPENEPKARNLPL